MIFIAPFLLCAGFCAAETSDIIVTNPVDANDAVAIVDTVSTGTGLPDWSPQTVFKPTGGEISILVIFPLAAVIIIIIFYYAAKPDTTAAASEELTTEKFDSKVFGCGLLIALGVLGLPYLILAWCWWSWNPQDWFQRYTEFDILHYWLNRCEIHGSDFDPAIHGSDRVDCNPSKYSIYDVADIVGVDPPSGGGITEQFQDKIRETARKAIKLLCSTQELEGRRDDVSVPGKYWSDRIDKLSGTFENRSCLHQENVCGCANPAEEAE